MGSTSTPSYAPPQPKPMITRMPNEADFEKDIEKRRERQQRKAGRGTKDKPFIYENVMGVGKRLGETAPATRRGQTVFNMGNY